MKVKVTDNFYDVTENLKLRKRGETLEVDKDRANHLLKHGLAKVITIAEQPDGKPVKKTKNTD